jgi:hypothetical protein
MSTSLFGSNVPPSAGTGSNVKYFVGILLFILLLVALYYLYQWMYGTNKSIISTPLLSSLTASTVVSTLDPNSVAVVNLTGISQGGQYSVSMWVYVSSTKSNISNLVHLLDITGGTSTTRAGNTLLFIGLDPANATLVVRQSSSGDDDTKMPVGSLGSTPSSNSYSLSSIITGYMSSTSNSTSSYTQDDRCDIMNGIEYQRWVLVNVVASGRTLDVYLDGKLSRSCVYRGNNSIGVQTGNAVVTIGNRAQMAPMTGYFSTTDYYNYALTPDLIWGIYQRGPTTSTSSFFTNLFNTDINFGTTSGLNS